MRHWQSIKFLLVIAGICWCVAIFRRRGEDVVIGIWVATAVVFVLLLTLGVVVVAEFWGMLRGQFRW